MQNTSDTNKPRVDYLYFGRDQESNSHNGVLTVAYRIADNQGKEYVEAAFAYCSPEDVFVKAVGRSKAHTRLEWGKVRNTKGTHTWARWGIFKKQDEVIACACKIFNNIMPHENKPLWIRNWVLVDRHTPLENLMVGFDEEDLLKRIVSI